MYKINVKQIKDQVRKHYNHVSKCDDHHNQSNNVQSAPGNCSCPDCAERINNIETRILTIEGDIAEINRRLTKIEGDITDIKNNNQPSQGTGMEETVTLSLSPPTAGTVRSTVSPNTVAFDSLLAEVEDMNADKMDEFYENFISPVIAQNGHDLLKPIPVSDLCGCTKIPSMETPDAITWDQLDGEDYIENKRAYIMQFILANRSNSTRAMYLTNQLIGAFALPL